MNLKTFQITVLEAPERLDIALLRSIQSEFPHISRARLKTWFQEKKIRFKNQPLKGSHELNPGSYEVTLFDCEWEVPQASSSLQGSFLPILYEDEDLLILNKFSGIPSAPHSREETETAVGSALSRFPGLASVGTQPLEPGLLHRLDNDTSGILAFAKNQIEFDRLKLAWKNREVKKIYRALATPQSPDRTPPHEIRVPLAHDEKSSKKMIALSSPSIRKYRGSPLPAVTRIHSWQKLSNSLFDFEIEIETGVMHQIRCHLSSQGFPLLGDTLYKGPPSERIWLHAWKLILPLKDKTLLCLESELPKLWHSTQFGLIRSFL
jgi:23S rRNA pseudouridine1911/1915/1917 synthase